MRGGGRNKKTRETEGKIRRGQKEKREGKKKENKNRGNKTTENKRDRRKEMEKNRGGKETTNKRDRRKDKKGTKEKKEGKKKEKSGEKERHDNHRPPPTTHLSLKKFLIHISQLGEKKTSYTKNAEIKHKITKPNANYIFYKEYIHHVQSK